MRYCKKNDQCKCRNRGNIELKKHNPIQYSRTNYEICVVGILGKSDPVMVRFAYIDQELTVFLWVYVIQ